MSFSHLTYTALIQAGWYPQRRTSIDLFTQVLVQEGYHVFPAAAQFLYEYGGLTVVCRHTKEGLPFTGQFHFQADQAAQAVYNEGYVSRFADYLKSEVCVIGEIGPGGTTLLIDPKGALYGGFDTHLVQLGQTVEEAIENLVQGGRGITIHE